MKRLVLILLGVALVMPVWAQDEPVSAEEAGLVPVTETTYINDWPSDGDPRNNGNTESLGVGIVDNGNIIVGWEDDGDDIYDYEAVWVLFDADGTPIIETPQSYFNSEGEPTSPQHAWGPKIKANLFGSGMGMGATAFSLALDIPEFFDVNTIGGDANWAEDFPAVQLLNNAGEPLGLPVLGISDEFAEHEGDVRIADWNYLSNGNIVIAGESRQEFDLIDEFGGDAAGRHPIFRIVTPDGTEVVPETLISEVPVSGEMWHGIGSIADGFAARWRSEGRTTVRLFNNDGTPKTGNIDLGDLTELEGTSGGGRGDGAGFHGNGIDTYVVANAQDADDFPGEEVYLTALNADGSLKWTTVASDDFEYVNADRVDCAVNEAGDVIAVWADDSVVAQGIRVVQARVFDAEGAPVTGTFYVSEKETPDIAVGAARRPRAFWRGDKIVVVWESENSPETPSRVVTMRIFEAPEGTGVSDFMIY